MASLGILSEVPFRDFLLEFLQGNSMQVPSGYSSRSSFWEFIQKLPLRSSEIPLGISHEILPKSSFWCPLMISPRVYSRKSCICSCWGFSPGAPSQDSFRNSFWWISPKILRISPRIPFEDSSENSFWRVSLGDSSWSSFRRLLQDFHLRISTDFFKRILEIAVFFFSEMPCGALARESLRRLRRKFRLGTHVEISFDDFTNISLWRSLWN